MEKFPSINQFRQVVKHIKTSCQYVGKDENGEAIVDRTILPPTLKFEGTVKVHGTNAGIVYDATTGEIQYQSRERVLSLTQDNAGFMLTQMAQEEAWRRFFVESTFESMVPKIAVYGEWAGKGIQKGVAVSEVDKFFVIFAIKLWTISGDTAWVPLPKAPLEFGLNKVFLINQFPTWEIDIDFKNPEYSLERMVEITNEVEAECPVGKYFGVSGIGEGVVWRCVSDGYNDSGTWFKVKGQAHSVSKVKTLATVDVEAIKTMNEFIEKVVTEARLAQGLDNLLQEQLLPFEMKSLGDFIRWVYNDVLKEEMDTIVENGIDTKKLGSAVANAARPWYIKKYNEGK